MNTSAIDQHNRDAALVREALSKIGDAGVQEIIRGQVVISIEGRKYLVDMTSEVSEEHLEGMRHQEALERALANVPPHRFHEIIEAIIASDRGVVVSPRMN